MTSHIPYDFSESQYLELYDLISTHLGAFPDTLLTSNLIPLWSENNSDIFNLMKFIKIYFYSPAYGLHW